MKKPVNLSVVVITLNEEENLPRMLASLPPGVELIVLDSGSTDRSRELCASFGARFEVQAFKDFSSQKNKAVSLASKDWVLSLDADEVPSPELWDEILEIVSKNDQTSSWRIYRRQFFLGKTLRFGKSCDSPLRLFPRNSGEFQNAVHESFVQKPGVSIKTCSASLLHFSYKNLTDYFARFNRYTSLVAEEHRRKGHDAPPRILHVARFFLEFFYRYIIRAGILDGYQGFVYAMFGSVYVFVKYAKLRELAQGGKSLPFSKSN
jgi:glycosyltransferase involved in cell wall biosynthesis